GLLQAHLRLGELDAAQRRLETIRKIDTPGKDLLALENEVTALAQQRDRLLKQWDVPKDKRTAATRILSQALCAERGFAERWPRSELERLVQEASADGLEYAPVLAMRGWLELEKGQLRKALADAESALKLQPTESRAHLVRGRVRLEVGNVDAALTDLRKAVELSKRQDAFALHWLAAALHESGRMKEAIETQKLAVLLRPNDAEMQ